MKISIPFMRSAHNYDRDEASAESACLCTEPSLALQSQFEDSDINTIVKRFGLTGQLPENVRMPSSGDFTGVGDYHTCANMVLAADEAFMEFPAPIRARFGHDPANLIDFMENPSNRDEAIKLGLVNIPPAATAPGAPPATTSS